MSASEATPDGQTGPRRRIRPWRPDRPACIASGPDPSAASEPARPALVYWLGLSSIFPGIGLIIAGAGSRSWCRIETVQYTTLASCRSAGVAHRGPRPADRRLDQRLHDQPLGPAQAVHPHRHASSTSCSWSGSRPRTRSSSIAALRRAAPVQLQLRPGAVPGLRPGPRPGAAGRSRERPWSGCCRCSASCSAARSASLGLVSSATSAARRSSSASSSS